MKSLYLYLMFIEYSHLTIECISPKPDKHTYIHTYIHTYKHTYIQTYIHTYKHTYIQTYIHTYLCKYYTEIRNDCTYLQHCFNGDNIDNSS